MTETETEVQPLTPEPEVSAAQAGLYYVDDAEPGFRRKRWGRGFTYLTPDGDHIRDPELRARFEALVIPPAWIDVWICTDPRGHIQVTGRDDEGRKVYIYHPAWDRVRNATKFSRLLPFGKALPRLRARVDADLRRRKPCREKVLALVVALLDETYIRIGNPAYAKRNQTYGLTTFRVEHVDVSATKLRFEFTGKSGKAQDVEVRNRRLARLVNQIQELPGQQLFQYVPDDGECCETVEAGDVNVYLREVTGLDVTAKDFRTWGGTVVAIRSLAESASILGPSGPEIEAAIRDATDAAAEALGNTRAVCRDYYIHPAVFAAYREGTLAAAMDEARGAYNPDDPYGLDIPELAVMHLLSA